MADSPIIPSAAEILTPAIDAIVAARPSTLRHINYGTGRWAHILTMWKAQAALALRRLADEVAQRYRATATGAGLLDLAADKGLVLATDATVARGELTLTRTGTNAGVIPKGTRFVRRANPTAVPLALDAAEYETSAPVIVPQSALTATVNIVATRSGKHANVVPESGVTPNDIAISTTLFDATFAPTAGYCAGGSDGISDAVVKRLMAAYATGQHGPVDGAILAGCLLGTGVRYAAILDNVTTARTHFYVADQSWGSSTKLVFEVAQLLQDEWEGFGLSVYPRAVDNKFIRVEPTIQLRDARYLSDTSEIAANVRAALRAYFDERPDWYRWKLAAVRAVISRADWRILTCATVAVKDRAGNVLSEPTVSTTSPPSSLTHYYLADDAVLLDGSAFVVPV